MSNVIFVDFSKNKLLGQDISTQKFSCIEDYLTYLLGEGLDMDDILDVADAIENAAFYMSADPEIQDLANFWFSYTKQL